MYSNEAEIVVQQNGERCVHFIIGAYKHEILHKMHLDVLFHIRVRGKLNYFNMAVKSKMAAIDPFEGLYANTCIHQSLIIMNSMLQK